MTSEIHIIRSDNPFVDSFIFSGGILMHVVTLIIIMFKAASSGIGI